MPYKTNQELPESVRNALPAEAQSIWRNVFNNAEGQGKPVDQAAQMAWGAVKNGWKKNEQGEWVKKVDFITKNAEKRYTLGVVYEPDVVDAQGDYASAPEIEKACWEFSKLIQGKSAMTKSVIQVIQAVQKALSSKRSVQVDVTDLVEAISKADGQGLGLQHSLWSDGLGDIVENYIAPVDFVVDGQQIKKGTWMMGIVWAPEHFTKVLNGQITGLSMGGTGRRIPVNEGGE